MSDARCNICYLPIHEQRSQMNCPRCFNEFHRDHLAAWLLKHKICPICREELSESFRDELRPKSERERRRLQDIFNTLDNLGDLMSNLEKSRRHKDRIMEARREEFGIGKIGITDIIKISIPFILLAAAGFALWVAFVNT